MMRVLIIDDEKSIRNTLRIFLEKEGYAVDTAETAMEALERIQTVEYDILISDIIMPKMSGVELLEKLQEYLVNVPILMMTGEPTVETAIIALQQGAFDYLYKPISKEALLKAVRQATIVRELAVQNKVLEQEKIEYLKNLEETVSVRTLDLDKSMQSSIRIMTSLVDSRDPYTSSHQIRVGNLSAAISRKLGLSEFQITGNRVIGYLHDIGKLSLPSEILVKPSKLSHFEFEIIKTHSESGYSILKDLRLPWPVAEVVWQHHEKLDGSGYPQGLKGEEILFEARILTVADVVEAMASHRPYRASLGLTAALEEIQAKKGKLFEPAIVEACIELMTKDGYTFDSQYYESSFIFY